MMKGMLSPGSVPLDRGSTAADGPPDSQLLARFAQSGDGAAFEQLVRRYGSMVLGVCRRVLGDANDAEDAFQATFLVLVRRAPSITQPELLGNWLYGVAYRVARKARAQRAKRAQQKAPAPAMSSPDPLVDAVLRELQAQLDEELERLPTKYRAPLVLCYLEGLSNREAAQRLGWPVGSISHRLARGRELLRQRLQDRHPNASYLVLGALPLFAAASAEVLPHLHSLALKLARTAADDEAEAAITESVRILAEQTLKEMSPARRPAVTLAVVVAVLLALSAVTLAGWKAFASGLGPGSGPAPVQPSQSSPALGPGSGPASVQPSQSTPATPCCHGSAPAELPCPRWGGFPPLPVDTAAWKPAPRRSTPAGGPNHATLLLTFALRTASCAQRSRAGVSSSWPDLRAGCAQGLSIVVVPDFIGFIPRRSACGTG